MKLALYIASQGTTLDRTIDLYTGIYGYSHSELVFSDGISFSASPREGKVRFKEINFDPKKWVLIDLKITPSQEEEIRAKAHQFDGKRYDYVGIFLWFVIPIRKQSDGKWWCSEIDSYLLGEKDFRIHPNKLAKRFGAPKQPFTFKLGLSTIF